MNDNKLIMVAVLLYLIISLTIHIVFFLTTIFKNKCKFTNISRHLFHRYFKQTHANNNNSG